MSKESQGRELRFVIIGAGMAGILSAIKLREAGFQNVTIYEKAARIGGTWRENTYPGLTCDVPSHSYTYSFAPNPDWSQIMPPGGEIQRYFEGIVADYRVDNIAFNQEVIRCEFDGDRWQLETAAGIKDSADFVIAATGVLHHPRWPDIKGADSFAGALFHSAQWDHAVPLEGKRIGIIGNGSTGVQIVSELAPRAAKLCHFQRTPQWIMPIENRPFTNEEKQALRSDPALLHQVQNDPTLNASIERFSEAIVDPDSDAMHEIETLVIGNLDNSVSDPVLREKLRPDYRVACKRLIFSTDYYEKVQHPNAELVVEGIECIEPAGVRTKDGRLIELDVIVFATGFHADQFMRPMNVTGRNGTLLNEVWTPKPTAYMAISIPEFPNLFMLNGPNGPVGNFSLIEIAEQQWHYISQLIDKVASGECRHIAATREALEAFDKARISAAKTTVFGSGCQSWYLDAEGVPATWPWSRARFAEEMQAPKLDAFEML
ncbi:NAD(P)/FAD-dependent oxidoreductase [Aestuariicella hydrocarbonica]|uniref:NAD(P)/FAD-dependent oxidoreductase n=1 Tax=Pseudomaricurvus hydrocarbonicus TaxID=1470433 RepID=A0A9E5JWD2_9GAMM|nr:NAD(P)/FAD-dependent oxidoreductase [Aestuariicella hydrocarbonica]NHO66100.1 NAD(P)/FAD-dependent oxidoreductase [Aestuariicella hydrocarbonica]